MLLKWKRLHRDAQIPQYAHEGDAGFDLRSVDSHCIWPSETVVVKTGLACEIPAGFEMQIRGRSGISAKTSLVCKIGTVDSGYRGEIGVILMNCGEDMIRLSAGERVAQGIVAPVVRCEMEEVNELSETARSDGGFGSTGAA